jgi:hypothetical protein
MYTATQVIGILMILAALWMCFEIWKAPLLRENPDGSYTTIKESKKIMDLFKKKNKKQ